MERLHGGATDPFRHHRTPPSAADRFLGMPEEQSNSSSSPPLELSEDDIFSTPSGSSSPSPTRRCLNSNLRQGRSISGNYFGILAALNANSEKRSVSGSGYDIRPVFNRKTSSLASLSSVSPSPVVSSKIMIPRPPPLRGDRARFRPKSAPVNVPMIPKAFQSRFRDLEDAVSEEEGKEAEHTNSSVIPPHEILESRHPPMLACSVLEGSGRTLKGKDLRQVRNAVWRKTGFLD